MENRENDTPSIKDAHTSSLYLFFDESGNFDFTSNGTSYFIMTCLVTKRPFYACHDLMDVKYDFFESGMHASKFHATSDKDAVKKKVYEIIQNHTNELTAYSVYIDKHNLPEDLRSADGLYSQVFESLVGEIFANELDDETESVIAITDDLPQDAKRRQVAKPLKRLLSSFGAEYKVKTYLAHFPSESDFNLQVVDYLCWAYMRYATGRGDWPWKKVSDIFKDINRI